jgi:hypothetical protein
MEEQAVYYVTYPLGIIEVSKIFTFIALGTGILMAYLLSPWYLFVYLVGYFLVLIYNIKYRVALCGYYGKTIHSNFGNFAQRFPPKVDVDSVEQGSASLTIISVLSMVIIVLPTFGLLNFTIANPIGNLPFAMTVILVYIFSIIIPGFIFKGKIFPAYCASK